LILDRNTIPPTNPEMQNPKGLTKYQLNLQNPETYVFFALASHFARNGVSRSNGQVWLPNFANGMAA